MSAVDAVGLLVAAGAILFAIQIICCFDRAAPVDPDDEEEADEADETTRGGLSWPDPAFPAPEVRAVERGGFGTGAEDGGTAATIAPAAGGSPASALPVRCVAEPALAATGA